MRVPEYTLCALNPGGSSTSLLCSFLSIGLKATTSHVFCSAATALEVAALLDLMCLFVALFRLISSSKGFRLGGIFMIGIGHRYRVHACSQEVIIR